MYFILDGGILFANGETWKEMRRFALSTLRDFGMGKKTVEDKIIEETQYLIKVFENHEGNSSVLYHVFIWNCKLCVVLLIYNFFILF